MRLLLVLLLALGACDKDSEQNSFVGWDQGLLADYQKQRHPELFLLESFYPDPILVTDFYSNYIYDCYYEPTSNLYYTAHVRPTNGLDVSIADTKEERIFFEYGLKEQLKLQYVGSFAFDMRVYIHKDTGAQFVKDLTLLAYRPKEDMTDEELTEFYNQFENQGDTLYNRDEEELTPLSEPVYPFLRMVRKNGDSDELVLGVAYTNKDTQANSDFFPGIEYLRRSRYSLDLFNERDYSVD
ncbi:MAG: hypothetical protein ACRCY4_09805 [Brevinema sp.]